MSRNFLSVGWFRGRRPKNEEPQQFRSPAGLLPADCPPFDYVPSAAGDGTLSGQSLDTARLGKFVFSPGGRSGGRISSCLVRSGGGLLIMHIDSEC